MNFYQTITAAVNEVAEEGFDAKRMEYWMRQLRQAGEKQMMSEAKMQKALKDGLNSIFRRLVTNRGIMDFSPGVPLFTVRKLTPRMKKLLDQRIAGSASLIRLNRNRRIEETLARFGGWATSIPAGGSDYVKRAQEKEKIKKALAQLPFEERRVLIDQGHKLTAAINAVVAEGGNAIAGRWHSNWRQPDYNYREDHKDRDEKFYIIRGSWADQRGLVIPKNGYTDEITQPAEEPFCRCRYRYVFSLAMLPRTMLTEAGKEAMKAKGVAA